MFTNSQGTSGKNGKKEKKNLNTNKTKQNTSLTSPSYRHGYQNLPPVQHILRSTCYVTIKGKESGGYTKHPFSRTPQSPLQEAVGVKGLLNVQITVFVLETASFHVAQASLGPVFKGSSCFSFPHIWESMWTATRGWTAETGPAWWQSWHCHFSPTAFKPGALLLEFHPNDQRDGGWVNTLTRSPQMHTQPKYLCLKDQVDQ